MEKSVVITGVSTGLGYGAARIFVEKGYRVFGSVRKQADADRVQEELGKGFTPLLFDVTDQQAVIAGAQEVEKALAGKGLTALINNAGIASGGPLMHQPLDEIRYQLEVNVVSLIGVTQAFLPLLGAKKNPGHPPGRIFNISSVGGKVAAPFLGAYVASKHAVEGLSHSLRRELLIYGIDVVVVGPGAVKTEIWQKPGATDLSSLEGTDFEKPGRKFQKGFIERSEKEGMELKNFSQQLFEIVEKSSPKTRYAVLNGRFANWTLPRILPDRMLDKAIGKQLGLADG